LRTSTRPTSKQRTESVHLLEHSPCIIVSFKSMLLSRFGCLVSVTILLQEHSPCITDSVKSCSYLGSSAWSQWTLLLGHARRPHGHRDVLPHQREDAPDLLGATRRAQGRGGIENKHSIDVESPLPRSEVKAACSDLGSSASSQRPSCRAFLDHVPNKMTEREFWTR
jgi:hypothetical protein